jgi:hypothetical protein
MHGAAFSWVLTRKNLTDPPSYFGVAPNLGTASVGGASRIDAAPDLKEENVEG